MTTKRTQLVEAYEKGTLTTPDYPQGMVLEQRVIDYWTKTNFDPVGKVFEMDIEEAEILGTKQYVVRFAKLASSQNTTQQTNKPVASEFKTENDEGIAPKHIQLNGKTYVTQAGLVAELHKKAEKDNAYIQEYSEIVNGDAENGYVVKATMKLVGKDDRLQSYSCAYGFANKANCGPNVAKHLLHMAETRAKNRAMRILTNVNVTSLEELDN